MSLTSAVPSVATSPRSDRHLRTDHLLSDLKGRSVRGGAVTLAAQGIRFCLQTGSTMVLARLLTPQDFGLVAMVTVVTGFVAMFTDAGLSMATVQHDKISHEQVSNLFWLNVGLSVVIMFVVAGLAPALGWFYGDQRLCGITLALAVTFVFSGLTVQHQALLRRQMRFRALATIDVLALACGLLTAITIAASTRSYWALVAMPVATSTATALGATVISGWVPGRPRRGTNVRPMLRYGGHLVAASFLTYGTQNVDKALLGFKLGATTLGFYRTAFELLMLPVRLLQGPVASVMLPALSRLQHKPAAYRRAYLRVMAFLALAGGPFVAFLFVEAHVIVRLVLGEQWADVAVILRCFAPAALLATIYSAPRYIFMTTGRTDRQARAAACELVLMVLAVVVGSRWGAVGVALSVSVSTTVSFTLMTYYATLQSPVSARDIVAHLGPHGLAALAFVAVGLSVSAAGASHPAVGAAVVLILGCAVYALVLAAFDQGRSTLAYAWSHLRRLTRTGRPEQASVRKNAEA